MNACIRCYDNYSSSDMICFVFMYDSSTFTFIAMIQCRASLKDVERAKQRRQFYVYHFWNVWPTLSSVWQCNANPSFLPPCKPLYYTENSGLYIVWTCCKVAALNGEHCEKLTDQLPWALKLLMQKIQMSSKVFPRLVPVSSPDLEVDLCNGVQQYVHVFSEYKLLCL